MWAVGVETVICCFWPPWVFTAAPAFLSLLSGGSSSCGAWAFSCGGVLFAERKLQAHGFQQLRLVGSAVAASGL